MNKFGLLALAGTAAAAAMIPAAPASARTFVSIGVGGPVGYGYYPGYYPAYYGAPVVYGGWGGGWYGRPYYHGWYGGGWRGGYGWRGGWHGGYRHWR